MVVCCFCLFRKKINILKQKSLIIIQINKNYSLVSAVAHENMHLYKIFIDNSIHRNRACINPLTFNISERDDLEARVWLGNFFEPLVAGSAGLQRVQRSEGRNDRRSLTATPIGALINLLGPLSYVNLPHG